MTSGRLGEDLSRMSAIADQLDTHCLVLFNESFAGTNEREGSEIARQIVLALPEAGTKVFFVTHCYGLAEGFSHDPTALFLRAERLPEGARNCKLVENRPLRTSFGQDLYYELGRWLGEEEPQRPGLWR